MQFSDDHWLSLADTFQDAALDTTRWEEALHGLALATGSQHGQLVCMQHDGSMPFNLLTGVDPELPEAFVAAGGADPAVNPRRRAGISLPPLTVICESDFITPDEMRRDVHYQEFALPWDVPYICLTPLDRHPQRLVGLSVIRTRSQGHIDDRQRDIFSSLAPQVRSAVRTHLALADQHASLMTDAFEALSTPVFICDRRGLVRRLSASAEALAARGDHLQLKSGKLFAAVPAQQASLDDAIAALASARGVKQAGCCTVILSSTDRHAPPLTFDAVALPRAGLPFLSEACVMLLGRTSPESARRRRATLLQSLYGMTAAEADIAEQLLEGRSAQLIAGQRNVSVGTVRVQIKSLLAKSGARRQADLVARLARL